MTIPSVVDLPPSAAWRPLVCRRYRRKAGALHVALRLVGGQAVAVIAGSG